MKSFATPDFWKAYAELPDAVEDKRFSIAHL